MTSNMRSLTCFTFFIVAASTKIKIPMDSRYIILALYGIPAFFSIGKRSKAHSLGNGMAIE
ncbi:hypothetical protein ABE52_26105 [Bacillus thuringiensis]|nr:hypothetical protein [Bacillus thuringiensis]